MADDTEKKRQLLERKKKLLEARKRLAAQQSLFAETSKPTTSAV